MSVHLSDLLDLEALGEAVAEGYVSERTHPTEPLRILNYTARAQYDEVWTPVTLQCRGLIVDHGGNVVARPFRKFFNYGTEAAGELDLNARVTVTDKMDGSLAILYPATDGYAIATRGSFTSKQALHATDVLRARYAQFEPPAGTTVLFEVIYPANRIVCDYAGLDDLVLLGAVDIATGAVAGPDRVPDWPGPRTEVFEHRTLADALAAPPREGAEGVVIHFPERNVMVKVKQDDYVALHRIMTQTTNRTVWEFLAVTECAYLIHEPKHWGTYLGLDPARALEILAIGPNWLDRLTSNVPDEFHEWLRKTIDALTNDAAALAAEIQAEADRLRGLYAGDRASLYAAAREHPHGGAVMLVIDGRDVTRQIWRALYPEPGGPWLSQGEDVA